MKELSIEQKAEAYNRVLKQIKECTPDENGFITIYPQEIFPELKESENIRIIKAIKYGLDHVFTNNTTVFEVTKEQCLAWLEKQDEQKLAWSEEDKYLCTQIEEVLQECWIKSFVHFGLYKKMRDFLKSLKDRVQPKQEWSDVDKDMLFRIIDNLKFLKDTISIDPKYAVNIIDIEREITWLKSLKYRIQSQNTWKPSDEQMDALHYVTNFDYGGHKATLVSLYEQLKKLREK